MPSPMAWLILLMLLLLRGSPVDLMKRTCVEKDCICSDSEGSNDYECNQEGEPISKEEGQNHYSYDSCEQWSDEYPICNGTRQSPIDIEIKKLDIVESPSTKILGIGYNIKPKTMILKNNGHTVVLTADWTGNLSPMIWGGPLQDVYKFIEMHFHWGPDNCAGSEHTINQHSYPLEMHMVHYKMEYDNKTNAMKYDDGLIVIAYLFSIDRKQNYGFKIMQSRFNDVLLPGQSKLIEPFPLDFFKMNVFEDGFISYVGSLTTPPCSEVVIWLVSMKIQSISAKQMETFRKIQLSSGIFNYRNVQPLNGRRLTYYCESGK